MYVTMFRGDRCCIFLLYTMFFPRWLLPRLLWCRLLCVWGFRCRCAGFRALRLPPFRPCEFVVRVLIVGFGVRCGLCQEGFVFYSLRARSAFSSNAFSPARVILGTGRVKLSTITLYSRGAITKLSRFISTNGGCNMAAITKVRFSARCGSGRLRVINLFVGGRGCSSVARVVTRSRGLGRRDGGLLIGGLIGSNCVLSCSGVGDDAISNFMGQTGVTATLVRGNCISSIGRTFRALLVSGFNCCIPPGEPSSLCVVRELGNFNSVSILTRPFLGVGRSRLERFLPGTGTYNLGTARTCCSLFSGTRARLTRGVYSRCNLLGDNKDSFRKTAGPSVSLKIKGKGLTVPARVCGSLTGYCRGFQLWGRHRCTVLPTFCGRGGLVSARAARGDSRRWSPLFYILNLGFFRFELVLFWIGCRGPWPGRWTRPLG